MKNTKRYLKLCATCGSFWGKPNDYHDCCGLPILDKTRVHVAEYDKDGNLVKQYEKEIKQK